MIRHEYVPGGRVEENSISMDSYKTVPRAEPWEAVKSVWPSYGLVYRGLLLGAGANLNPAVVWKVFKKGSLFMFVAVVNLE